MILDRTGALLLAALALSSLPAGVDAFHVPSTRMSNRRSLNHEISPQLQRPSLMMPEHVRFRKSVLRMAGEEEGEGEAADEAAEDEEDDPDAAETSASDDDATSDDDEDPAATLTSYKSGLNARRIAYDARPGSYTASAPSIDVTMKFGGSSLANSERVDHVANLIKDRIRPPPSEDGSPSADVPVRPRAGELVREC